VIIQALIYGARLIAGNPGISWTWSFKIEKPPFLG